MYRNSEHYADPTAGRALAHLIASDQRRRGKNSHASKPVPQRIINPKTLTESPRDVHRSARLAC